MIRAIFFDFDGTISDAKGIAVGSMIRTLEDFGYDIDRSKFEHLLGIKMHRILDKLGIKNDVEKMRNSFYKYFVEGALGGKIKPCVSLKPLWKIKGEDRLPLIVVSNSRTKFLHASIKTLRIGGLFDKVVGAEKFDYKDDMLRILFKRMKIKPSEAIYVGDRFSDIEFARKAGCVAVAIHNKCSWSTLDRIEKEKPDFIVRDFYGLRRVVKILNKAQ